jgi:hypothetical protein
LIPRNPTRRQRETLRTLLWAVDCRPQVRASASEVVHFQLSDDERDEVAIEPGVDLAWLVDCLGGESDAEDGEVGMDRAVG